MNMKMYCKIKKPDNSKNQIEKEENKTLKRLLNSAFDRGFIHKDKIKEKIKHYEDLLQNYIKKYDETNQGLEGMINVLKELLEV